MPNFFAVAAGYFLQGNTASLDAWHSVMLVYPVAALVYGLYGALRGGEKPVAENLPIIIGIVAAFGFSGYDIYFYAADRTPFVLLQGIGFMSLIIGTFYSFSQEIADTNKKCDLYADEMARNKAQRDELFASKRAASTLDHIEVPIHLIGAIKSDVNDARVIQVHERYRQSVRHSLGCDRSRDPPNGKAFSNASEFM